MTRAEELALIEDAVREGRVTRITDEMVQARLLWFPGSHPVMRKPLRRSRPRRTAKAESKRSRERQTYDANKELADDLRAGYTVAIGATTIRG